MFTFLLMAHKLNKNKNTTWNAFSLLFFLDTKEIEIDSFLEQEFLKKCQVAWWQSVFITVSVSYKLYY